MSASDAGVSSIEFVDDAASVEVVHSVGRAAVHVDRAVTQLNEYFAGERRDFDVEVDLVGTEFQRGAWAVLRRIPYGRTISYKEQAASMGRPTATRAVGAANGRNPVPIIVPCHRVIGASGGLTGFSAGIDRKVWLLNHERGHVVG